MRRNQGFTLIEVLIALVIVGMALPAMLIRMQGILDNTSHMGQKTYAYWLAENKMQEMIISQKLQGKITKTKKDQGNEEFAGQSWFWLLEVEETAVENMFRMEISVGVEEGVPIATLVGFINE